MTPAELFRLARDKINCADYRAAASLARQLSDRRPRDVQALILAAESLYLYSAYGEAIEYANRVLGIDPGNLQGLIFKARILHAMDEHQAGISMLESAIEQSSENIGIRSVLLNELAFIRMDLGDLGQSYELFLESVALDKRNCSSLLHLSAFRDRQLPDEHVRSAESMASSDETSDSDKIMLHFALAEEYRKRRLLDAQFSHLNAGNRLQNQRVGYDPVKDRARVNSYSGIFSERFLRKAPKATAEDRTIIFIVGMPRSGSTLLEQIVSSHDSVTAAGEVPYLTQSIQDFQGKHCPGLPYPDFVRGFKHELIEIGQNYLRQIARAADTPFVTDKALLNYEHLGLIRLLFPQAKIIDMRRHPVDCCFSCYRQLFQGSALPFVYSLENLAAKYRLYRELMAHWSRVMPDRILQVNYEQLITDPEATIRWVLDHCGLEWDAKCLNFHAQKRSVRTRSSTQVRSEIYRDSVGSWESARDYLGPLLELLD